MNTLPGHINTKLSDKTIRFTFDSNSLVSNKELLYCLSKNSKKIELKVINPMNGETAILTVPYLEKLRCKK